MTQYPNEKDPQSNWISPPQGAYASRDGAPPQAPEIYASSSQSPGPPPQGCYPPPQDPPPAYGSIQSQYSHERKGTSQETYLSPPANVNPYGAPAQAGPSSSPSQDNQGGIMMSIAAFFGNKGPPPMWSRQPPPPGQLPYNAFPPMCLISNSKDLSSGFPGLPPPCQLNPHPFSTHDVTEEDWKRFLGDVKQAGSLSPAQRIRSNLIPTVAGAGFVGGFFATSAIERKMKYKNRQAAGDVVDHWNHYFFGPRRMEVVLCQASERLSGRVGAAPVVDPYQTRMANGLRQRTDSLSSSSDDSSDDDRRGHGHSYEQGHAVMTDRQARRVARKERRAIRRERKSERRERKARGENKLPYELYITSI